MEPEVSALLSGIERPSEEWRSRARQHLDTLTKPLGSLGRLEDMAAQIAAIRRERMSEPARKAVYVFAADHGVAESGVSAYPREVTVQMVHNFLSGGAAINVLARQHDVALHVVDVGVDTDFGEIPGLLHHKVKRGTRNMLHAPAMSREEALAALHTGYRLASEAAAAGCSIIATGEMGIGNTTAASAITCALTGATASRATGRGTGANPATYANKVRVVEAAVAKHFSAPAAVSSFEILRCLGGFEIAAMAGVVLAAAQHRMVMVLDGFISTAAAAVAVGMAPDALGYLIAGHCSEEPGHSILLEHLGLAPVLSLGMRLGEGTGAVLAMPVIESAIALYHRMATFTSAGISGATP
ncbi:nicotinate-nucleotide--dimethylbenzimidazole phosphoribosyltransferase [Silvibacterium dinghuense]|uniref:Nicotinate-nucleotide--dimethylbenzimidazole phosphoribosyltransferase n=1 Tax=Silvibacterium dinghuense TaxID=1560006 RepID=A0A4Q1SJ68_9BACT|nr:nicotinate-nucleotide--dimethylbenzimidazole phosphoribosyltransferase [Silvibacterium dinghuense]RXS97678.1 nicotinate-nucleotide--dimethylbenzimidazole phosphoribosyltransferase [Silvibacterium dinghuense]GGH01079.1 nicotinate-nucleotide--dimethylbenzimidazole phosphoribosyltransferase [Silvibacterium dinghuense]